MNEVEVVVKSVDQSASGYKSASQGAEEYTNKVGVLGEKADNSERNLIGIHDVIDGTATIMQGPGQQGIVAYIQGWADLAGGAAPLLEAFSKMSMATLKNAAEHVASAAKVVASWVVMAAQATLSAARMAIAWVISLGPVALIIAAITAVIAIIVYLAVKTDFFQKLWKVAWEGIKNATLFVWNWIKDHWPLLLAILTGPIGLAVLYITKHWDSIVNIVKSIPGRIGKAAAGMWDGIKDAFRSALNWIIDRWNSLHFSIPGFDAFGIHVGGFSLGVPSLPHFAHGGIGSGLAWVGDRGRELVDLGAGGRVYNNEQANNMMTNGGRLELVLEVVPRSGMSNAFSDAIVENLNFRVRNKQGVEFA
jgi:hypothetical protein